jgi:hypothetical protein
MAMLNPIPLHCFLAKPHSGEVIETNTKFDAYRRCQPQESRVRDPWQSIHLIDHIAKQWTKALRPEPQRVRLKRLNDKAAYPAAGISKLYKIHAGSCKPPGVWCPMCWHQGWFIFHANPLLSAAGELLY